MHLTGDWRVADLWIVRTIGHDMITAQGLISAPNRILKGSGFMDSAPYRILEGSGFS